MDNTMRDLILNTACFLTKFSLKVNCVICKLAFVCIFSLEGIEGRKHSYRKT